MRGRNSRFDREENGRTFSTDDGVAIERKGGAVDGSATRLSPRDNPSRITYSDDASYVLVDVNPERPT